MRFWTSLINFSAARSLMRSWYHSLVYFHTTCHSIDEHLDAFRNQRHIV